VAAREDSGADLGAGPVVGDRYELGPLLGVGGMARVHAATDTLLARRVAVKIFRVDADPSHACRIENEMRVLASVAHPGLVSVFDAGTWTASADSVPVPFLVMELVDGQTLAQCCVDGQLPVEHVVEIGAALADALSCVHARGIVHRDVKPANILLNGDGRAKLADFGIARLVDGARHTQIGMTVGTAAYLSPEQVKGLDVGPASDVYSLGLVLLEAVSGRREYAGNDVETALARLQRRPEVPEHLPLALRDLLESMTASQPGDRPTAAEVAARLIALRDLAPLVAATPAQPSTRALTRVVPLSDVNTSHRASGSVLSQLARDAARNRYVVDALMLLTLLLAGVVLLASTVGDSPDQPAPARQPDSQLERDLAELREAVRP
jgi:serine/threonine protein kinase